MRPRSLIVVLLLMNYMGLADKHNDKIDVLEIFAGTAVFRMHVGCQCAFWSQNIASQTPGYLLRSETKRFRSAKGRCVVFG